MTYVSASQISTFRDCKRKWAWGYVEGIKSPPNKSAQLGLNVHKILEHWFTNRQAPDLNTKEGQIAGSGLQHSADAFEHDCRAEQKFVFEFDGVTYLGYIDLHYAKYLDGHVPGNDPVDELIVTDHKTTSDFKWAKTEEDLRTDPQRVIYAVWATLAYGVDKVRARWVYYLTNPPYRSRPVELCESRDEIWDAFASVHETAQEIVASRHLKVLDFEQNLNACDAYGGCFYKDRCIGKMTARERMKAILSQAQRAERAERERHAPPVVQSKNINKNVQAPRGITNRNAQLGNEKKDTMSFLDKLKNGSSGKPQGIDPAATRKAYDEQQKKETAAAPKPKAAAAAPPKRSTNGPAAPKPSIKEQLAALKAKQAETPTVTETDPREESSYNEAFPQDTPPPMSENLEPPEPIEASDTEQDTPPPKRTRGANKPKEPKEQAVNGNVTPLSMLQACAEGGLPFEQAMLYLEAYDKLSAA